MEDHITLYAIVHGYRGTRKVSEYQLSKLGSVTWATRADVRINSTYTPLHYEKWRFTTMWSIDTVHISFTKDLKQNIKFAGADLRRINELANDLLRYDTADVRILPKIIASN